MTMRIAFVALTFVGCSAQPSGPLGVSMNRPTSSMAISADGLVLAFDMSSTVEDGRLRDFGPHGLHGTTKRTKNVQGPRSDARELKTVDDRVDLPESPQLAIDGPLTIAAWFRVSQLGLHQHVIACDDKFALWVVPENKLRFVDTLGHGAQTKAPIERDRWMSVVAVFDGGAATELSGDSIKIFINGHAVELEPVNRANESPLRWSPGPMYPSDACYIGFESHQGEAEHQQLPFVGAIDELMVFRRAWTVAEVTTYSDGS